MPPGFSGNLIFAIIARMLCRNHLNSFPLTLAQFAIIKAQANKKHRAHVVSLNTLCLFRPVFVFNPGYSIENSITWKEGSLD